MSTSPKTAAGPRPAREAGFPKDADKLIRRLSLVAYLLTRQNRPVRAEQIRRQVEGYALMTDDAFKRRFYEDRAELELLGIAISGESDEDGGELYSLPAAAYYLPAVDLTHEELLALGACLLVLEGRFAYSKPLRLALLSLAEGRPELLEQDVAPPLSVLTAREALRANARLPRLQTAVADRKTVVFDYYAIGRDEVSERTVDPYGMLLVGDEWYLLGRCHRRRALRTFRLSRIRSRIRYATRRPHDFAVPDDVSLSDLRDRPPWQLDAGGDTALIRVSERMAWWVEAHYGRCGSIAPEPDGGILFTTRFAAARPLVGWVLGLGEAAEIIAPQSLRDQASEQLGLLQDRLDDPPPTASGRGGRAVRLAAASRSAGHAAGRRTRDGGDWQVEVDRFTRLTALASYLLAHCGPDGAVDLPVERVCAALGTTPAELRADVRLLNLVNFGGDGNLLYADLKHRRLEVQCDMAGPALARPARLSPLQADTLLLAVELVGGRIPSASAGALRSAAEKIRAARQGPPPALQSSPAVSAADDTMILVNAAIREHRLLHIEYWSEGRDELTSRTVEPYMVVRQRGEWYAVCFCRRSQAVRTFRLATMRSVRLDDECFEPRADVQLDLYRHEGIPASRDYAPQTASVWYSPAVARWVAEREAVRTLGDGACLADVPYLDTPWLVHTLLRFGGQAVPLAPPEAVAALREAVLRLRERYGTRRADRSGVRSHGDTRDGGAVPWVWSGRRRLTLRSLLRSPAVDVHFVPPPSLARATDIRRSLREALAHPLEAPRLSELAHGARSVAIAVPDSSRALPVDAIVPALIEELAAGGVAGPRVTVVVGCGAHRAPTGEERRRLTGGPAVTAAGVRLSDAQAQTPPHRTIGRTRLGCPISLCDDVATAALTVSVGIVEPHLYAGFSGGVKGVAIGCAAEETIAWTHAPAFISHPGVELLMLADNPFQDTLREIAAATSLRYAVNAVNAGAGAVSRIAAGHPAAVQETLARHLTPSCLHEVERPFDVVIAGIPAPKHESLYQASRAATYLGLGAHPPVRDGGLIVLCAGLPGGFGDGPGERRFAELLAGDTPDELVARGSRGSLGPGGQRAFVVARVMQRCRLAVAGAADPEVFGEVGIGGFSSVEHALDAALPATSDGAPRSRVLVIADALSSVVRLRRHDGPPESDIRGRG